MESYGPIFLWTVFSVELNFQTPQEVISIQRKTNAHMVA